MSAIKKNAETLPLSSTLSFQHEAAFEPDQARVCEVKRNGEADYAIRIEPIFGKPSRRRDPNPPVSQLRKHAPGPLLDQSPFQRDGQIAEPQSQKVFVGEAADFFDLH